MVTAKRAGLWLAVIGLATAHASAADSACWTRTYSADHLAAHPGQQVSSMWLDLETPEPDGAVFGTLGIGLSIPGAPSFEATILCEAPVGTEQACGVACDGGSFTLTHRANDGSVLLSNTSGGLSFLECGANDAQGHYWLRSDPEHRQFRLYAC